jgi:hypothetical protein
MLERKSVADFKTRSVVNAWKLEYVGSTDGGL